MIRNRMTLVIVFLGSTLILGLGLIGLIAFVQRPIPDILELVTVGALTAISGILSRTGEENTGDQAGGEHARRPNRDEPLF